MAKKIGRFAMLGLAEDTGARNQVIERRAFLDLTYDIDEERQWMCLLDGSSAPGGAVCVSESGSRPAHCWRHSNNKVCRRRR